MPDGPLAIIPARGGSKRLPGKNLADLAGKPLLAHAIEAGRASGVFDAVCVSSDDPEVLDAARRWEADMVRDRPAELATDEAQVKDVCRHILMDLQDQGTDYDSFGVLLTTNPLRTAGDVRSAWEAFLDSDADFLMSLVPFRHPPQRAVRIVDGYIEPAFGRDQMVQTQRLEPLYRHDGAVLFARTDAFLEEDAFYGSRTAAYEMPPERSVDIDEPIDLEWARFLLSRRAGGGEV